MPEIVVDERDLEPTFLDATEAQISTDDVDARSLLSTHLGLLPLRSSRSTDFSRLDDAR